MSLCFVSIEEEDESLVLDSSLFRMFMLFFLMQATSNTNAPRMTINNTIKNTIKYNLIDLFGDILLLGIRPNNTLSELLCKSISFLYLFEKTYIRFVKKLIQADIQ